ncbi:MAG: hypothetical protein KDJ97_22515 [Anaerolineae bacterium]|nr:hypothetical protein [Anaerolineae bacterium]
MSKTKSSFITHHSSIERRPVEDFVLARIELEERLHRLKDGHYRMAIFHLSGFTGHEVAQIFGCSRTTVTSNTRKLYKNGE